MTKKKRSKSSKIWLNKNSNEYYFSKAKNEGYRSRAAYKLIELQQNFKLFKPGMLIIDLGSSPGSWSQVLTKYIGKRGKIIALDILDMSSIPGVHFIKGNFLHYDIYKILLNKIKNKKVDWVVSDMSPNITGNQVTDQAQSINLIESALKFSKTVLKKNGGFLSKAFQGKDFNELMQKFRENFYQVTTKKPHASKPNSREIYIVAI